VHVHPPLERTGSSNAYFVERTPTGLLPSIKGKSVVVELPPAAPGESPPVVSTTVAAQVRRADVGVKAG
jgi:hypothetical protein